MGERWSSRQKGRLWWGGVLFLALLPVWARGAEASQGSKAVTELQTLPPGLTLPVQMGRTLRAGKTEPGTRFVAETTQRVPVAADAYLNRGVKVRGEVVASTSGDGTAAHPSVLTIRFTALEYRGKTVPVLTRAVAIANIMEVDSTFVPMTAAKDRSATQASWTTRQVGGDEVYRSGWVGDVADSTMHTVGNADFYGVYSLPVMIEGRPLPRAMGVFSTSARGLYAYADGAILESSGGSITVTSPEKHVVIRNGDNLLLEVVAAR